MDGLFQAINLKDLLSTVDVSDPSTPLSSPDLRLLISKLDSHSIQIKSKIRSYLLSHHEEFSNLFSLCNEIVSCTNDVSSFLSDLLSLLSDCNIDKEAKKALEEIKEKTREAREKREVLELVKVVVELEKRFRDVRDAIKNGKLQFAAEEIRVLKEEVRIGEEEDGEPLIYGVFRKEWVDCYEEIQEALLCIVRNAVIFEPEQKKVRVQYFPNGVDIRIVLDSMEVLGVLDYGFAKIADQMIKVAVVPCLSSGTSVSFSEEMDEASHKLLEATLTITVSPDPVNDMAGESFYLGVIQVVIFITKCICFQKISWINCFGRLTWPRISNIVISNYLSKAVPNHASELAGFHQIIKRTREFELALKEANFVSELDTTLSSFAENVEAHFAARKKKETLATARSLVLQYDTSFSQEPSAKNRVDLFLVAESCLVSDAAILLMDLVHRTLQDSCVSSPMVAAELYHAARDAILLYEAIIPVKLERQLNEINLAAALVHNDCLYLYQEILGLAFEYRSQFPPSIKDHAVFVDIAPRFQKMAGEILEKQIQIVVFNLGEAVDGADGFQNTHQPQKYESAKFSVEQVVFILEKVHLVWEPILIPSTYKRSMCRAMDSVFSRVARDILLLDDMAAEETLELQKLIHLMVESTAPLVKSVADTEMKDGREASMPSWRKIRKLAELLDMPLKSITQAWESGELRVCGFASSEVKDFIKAIFTDSPLRKECIMRIQHTSV